MLVNIDVLTSFSTLLELTWKDIELNFANIDVGDILATSIGDQI